MSAYDSADLLALFKSYAGRPTADVITDAQYYARLTRAQDQVVTDIAGTCPWVLYPTVDYASIPTLTTADGGQTFTFGMDANGYALTPMGEASIYRALTDIPDCPMVKGRDYIPLGGTAIQIPNDNTYNGTLYWRGISPPGPITATDQPALFPEASRELIAIRAAANFGMEGSRNTAVYQLYSTTYGYPLAQNTGRFAWWCLTWRSQFAGGGALLSFSGRAIAIGSAANYAGT